MWFESTNDTVRLLELACKTLLSGACCLLSKIGVSTRIRFAYPADVCYAMRLPSTTHENDTECCWSALGSTVYYALYSIAPRSFARLYSVCRSVGSVYITCCCYCCLCRCCCCVVCIASPLPHTHPVCANCAITSVFVACTLSLSHRWYLLPASFTNWCVVNIPWRWTFKHLLLIVMHTALMSLWYKIETS